MRNAVSCPTGFNVLRVAKGRDRYRNSAGTISINPDTRRCGGIEIYFRAQRRYNIVGFDEYREIELLLECL